MLPYDVYIPLLIIPVLYIASLEMMRCGINSFKKHAVNTSTIDVTNAVYAYGLRGIINGYNRPLLAVQRIAQTGSPTGNNGIMNIRYTLAGNLDTNAMQKFANAMASTGVNLGIVMVFDQVAPHADNTINNPQNCLIMLNNAYLGYINDTYNSGSAGSTTSSISTTNKPPIIAASQTISIVCVCQVLQYANNNQILGVNGTQITRNLPPGSGGYGFLPVGAYASGAIISDSTWNSVNTARRVHVGTYNKAEPLTQYIINNGLATATNNVSVTLGSGTCAIMGGSTATVGAGFYYNEWIIYNAELTSTRIANITSNIRTYYGI